MTVVTGLIAEIISAVGDVFAMITAENVLPFFGIGIAASLTLLGVKIVRSIVWGA